MMRFDKMQGLGNDYIYIDTDIYPVNNPSSLSRILSDRHYGIGGDGIVLYGLEPTSGNYHMSIYNSDGSRAEMCGNAIRCLAKLLYDNDKCARSSMCINTDSGLKCLSLDIGTDGNVGLIHCNMGIPSLSANSVGATIAREQLVMYPLDIDGDTVLVTAINVGNPHCVIIEQEDIYTSGRFEQLAHKICTSEYFTKGINVELVNIISRNTIAMRVFERGAGETLACGTGACASVVATIINGHTDNKCYVRMRGGELMVQYTNNIIMSGEAGHIFNGEIRV